MAYCKVIRIKSSMGRCIGYVVADKKGNDGKDDLEDVLEYVSGDKLFDEVVFKTVTNTINCTKKNANKEMASVRKNYNKKNVNLGYHFIQNFGGTIEAEIANEIGTKLAERLFTNFQAIISTHTNTERTHNHIVINSIDMFGKNYYDNDTTYRNFRRESDRLCKEYGLPVMTETKDYKTYSYIDKNGKRRTFEPTERKRKMIDGEIGNPNDYRNNGERGKSEYNERKSNVKEVRERIDALLPMANTYEELLSLLRKEGYTVKAKTKKGDWRRHVTFQAPLHEKGTRDTSLGEGYVRERLEQRILDGEFRLRGMDNPSPPKNVVGEYSYGMVDIGELDYENRYVEDGVGCYKKVERSELEKYVLAEIKDINKELNEEYKNTTRFQRFTSNRVEGYSNYETYLMNSINNSLRALSFMEERNVHSLSQIKGEALSLFNKREEVLKTYKQIKGKLSKASDTLAVIRQYVELKRLIADNVNAKPYEDGKYGEDLRRLNECEKTLWGRGLVSEEDRKNFVTNYEKNYVTFLALSKDVEAVNLRIGRFDNLVLSIRDVNKRNGTHMQEDEIKDYLNETKEFRSGRYRDEKEEKDVPNEIDGTFETH